MSPDADLHSRLIAPLPPPYGSTELVSHFAPTLLRRLLVFDTYVLQTVRFTEFYTLARVLGVDTVVRLLSSGTLQLELDPRTKSSKLDNRQE